MFSVSPGRGLRLAARKGRKVEASTNVSEHTPKASRQRLLVLIVDDIQDTRELYEHFFELRGARALTAEDGSTALQMVRRELPDVVVLDLAMPGVTGWDVIREMKADPATRDIPIVVLSGQSARESALEAGADAYVAKPCVPDDLMTEVLRSLRHPGHRRDH